MKHHQLFEAIARAASVRINEFIPQSLVSMAWSFTVFDIGPKSFIPADSPFAQALLSSDPSSFNAEDMRQLHQFQLW
jgi:hypothetical protein